MTNEALEMYQDKIIRSLNDSIRHMKYIENRFRNSNEYKEYIKHFRITYCSENNIYFKDSDYETDKVNTVTTELHHHITLFDIVQIATAKLLSDNKWVIINDVISEVIKIHMQNYPCAVILAKNEHELHHKGEWTYDEKLLRGDYKAFLKEYDKYIPEEIKERYASLYECNGKVKTTKNKRKPDAVNVDRESMIRQTLASIRSIDDLKNISVNGGVS